MFIASVGMHIVHPFLHRHDAGPCHEAHCGCDRREARVAASEARHADGHGHACPICHFLAFVHGQAGDLAEPVVSHDRAFEVVSIHVSEPCPHHVRGAHYGRAPPSPFAEPGFSDGKRFAWFVRSDKRNPIFRLSSARHC
jgi:hypothetical protein